MGSATGLPEHHEQFVERAMRVFPADETIRWTKLERALFNTLTGELIFRHGYAGVTDQMLAAVRREMADVIRRFGERRAPL